MSFRNALASSSILALAFGCVASRVPNPAYGPVTDVSPSMLAVPRLLAERTDVTVATHAPRVTVSTFTGLEPLPDEPKAIWSCFGEGLCTPEGSFVVAVGTNRLIDGNCCLYEYDPAIHANRRIFDMGRFLGHQPGRPGHGKLHGRLDESPDGSVTLVTYPGLNPETPINQRMQFGSRVVRHNLRTGKTQDFGMPVLGDVFPMNATDVARGRVFGAGLFGGFLAYDLHARRILYGKGLPEGFGWGQRGTIVDPDTGCCYGSETQTRRIVKFDPNTGTFSRTKAAIPPHPVAAADHEAVIRTYTRKRLRDGSFIVMTSDGILFKFFPDEERTQLLGTSFADGLYCAATALSPDERYLYYAVGIHAAEYPPHPLIQLDLATGRKKVLAFLGPWCQAKHGYRLGLAYSCCIDPEGRNLLLAWNGRFAGPKEDIHAIGHPLLMYVEIPESERPAPPRTP